MRDRRRTTAGYSMLEMIFALALMVIVVAQLMLVLTSQHESYSEHERLSATQQDARLLADVILRDLRMAGFMVPREVAIGSIDGGTGGSDVLCMSDANVFAAASYASATDRFEGAAVTNVMTGDDSSVTLTATDMDIDSDGNADFAAGSGILVSDGSRVHCATIASVSGSVVSFAPATPSGASFTATQTFAVPAVVYLVNGTTLFRNATTLSTQTEDLQVELGIDADGDGEIEGGEFPIHDVTGNDLSRARLARIHVTTRTTSEKDSFVGGRAAAANRVAGSADGFRRRKVTADAVLRNLL